jgi:hypothetical protein
MLGYEFIARKIDQKIDIEWGGVNPAASGLRKMS